MRSGYTLVELIVSLGLFAIITTLAAGAYFMIIGLNRQAEGITTGIDNLSFALETMTREIRTGTGYPTTDGTSNSFTFTNNGGTTVAYDKDPVSGALRRTAGGTAVALTDPSVTINNLSFTTTGGKKTDQLAPRVTIIVQGTVSVGSGGKTRSFNIETTAEMRGTDF
ncbi:MAG: prepilin-type N-terminal cleavage/methylation domain-containing protein [Minisyncoccia bacterium]